MFVIGGRSGQTKTHDRCQPWVLSKLSGLSTNANGVVTYDDNQQDYLPNCANHGQTLKNPPIAVKR